MINALAGQSALSSRSANLFSKIDANTDGSVTKEEFIAARPKDVSETDAANLFTQMDTEGTGSLSESQLTEGMEKNRSEAKSRDIGNSLSDIALQAILQLVQNANASNDASTTSNKSKDDLFSKIDTDGDGSVTKEEFIAARPDGVSEDQATQLFSSIDTEGTGSVTKSQLEDGMKANAPSGAPSGPPPSGPPPSGGGVGAPSGGSSSSSDDSTTYDALDTNEDGNVSMAELLAGLQTETDKSGNESTKALLSAITDALNTYAKNNSIDLESISAFKTAA